MREIKFRAWAKNAERMVSWEKMKQECNRLSLIEDSNFIFMQYTDLKDKNGVEIYEGDVCCVEGKKSEPNAYKVWFHDGSFTFDDYTLIREYQSYSMEVIGNIYENPELLKSDDKSFLS